MVKAMQRFEVAVGKVLGSLLVMALLGTASVSQASLMYADCSGLPIAAEVEGNDTIGTAQNIDSFFNTQVCDEIELGFDVLGNPFHDTLGVVPHATIENDIAHDQRDLDFFEFTVAEDGVTGIFDIDFGDFDIDTNNFDDSFNSWIEVYDAGGNRLGFNGLGPFDNPEGDDNASTNSFLEVDFATAGLYYVAVGQSCGLIDFLAGRCTSLSDSIAPMEVEKSYLLNVSLIGPAQVPVPGTLLLLVIGAAGAGLSRRRRITLA